MNESVLSRVIRLAVSKIGARLFRNQVGLNRLADPRCSFCRQNGRRFRSGLGVGSPDLVGWHSIQITPEMVGTRVAIFTGVELKSEKGRPSSAQLNWISAIREAGGRAGVAKSEEDARQILIKEIAWHS